MVSKYKICIVILATCFVMATLGGCDKSGKNPPKETYSPASDSATTESHEKPNTPEDSKNQNYPENSSAIISGDKEDDKSSVTAIEQENSDSGVSDIADSRSTEDQIAASGEQSNSYSDGSTTTDHSEEITLPDDMWD